jgi:hypothetical protein
MGKATQETPLKFHPAASIFLLLEDEDLQSLADSIRDNGLKESVKLHDGLVIDGRNRLAACRMAGVKPRFETVDVNGSPAAYVYAVNYHRRHLSEGGKQLAAGRYKEVTAAEAKERQRAGGGDKVSSKAKGKAVKAILPEPVKASPQARDIAGAAFGVSGKTVDAAAIVIAKAAPEVIKAVESGKMKVATAARLASAPKDVQVAALAGGKADVRKAIETHTPSVKEEAKNDAGVKWHDAMHKVRVLMKSNREAGGIAVLTNRWTDAQRLMYVNDIHDLIEELKTWYKVLGKQ